jgi:hypothetical protein
MPLMGQKDGIRTIISFMPRKVSPATTNAEP